MTRVSKSALALALLIALLQAACEPGCETAGCDPTGPGALAAALSIDAPVTEFAVGDTVQFTSLVLDAAGDTLADVTVQWSSLSPSVATVSASGKVAALDLGTSRIVARVGKARDTVEVTVRVACSSVAPQGAVLISGPSSINVTGTNCVRGGEARSVRGYQVVVPTDHEVRLQLSPVQFGDSVVITNAAGTDTIVRVAPWLTGSGGAYYLLLYATASLPSGSYVVWVLRDGTPTSSATLSVEGFALCRGMTINRSIAVNDSLNTSHSSASCLMSGTYAEGWEFTAADTMAVSFSLLLSNFSIPHLLVSDSAMDTTILVSAYTDRLMLDAVVPPGNWRLWVTSQAPGPMYPSGVPGPPGGFPFTLTRNPAPPVCGAATVPIVVGVPVAGSLNSGDCVLDGTYARARSDQFTFTVASEATYDFSLSASFAPAHFLRASNDSIVMVDYASFGGSVMTRKTLAPGTYTYIVRPSWTGTVGTYTASITQP